MIRTKVGVMIGAGAAKTGWFRIRVIGGTIGEEEFLLVATQVGLKLTFWLRLEEIEVRHHPLTVEAVEIDIFVIIITITTTVLIYMNCSNASFIINAPLCFCYKCNFGSFITVISPPNLNLSM